MRLLVGLGNPGQKYEKNRHNIGFMAVDAIARTHGFPPFRRKFQGLLSEGRLGDTRVALLKPETYMNLSGNAVNEAARFFRIDAGDIVAFHDEIDLAPGRLKVKTGGGHAGHNGLRSIQSHLGADFVRVRMGVGHPGSKDAVAAYVLRDFPKADEEWLDDMLRGVADGAPDLAAGDTGRFMNAVARRLSPSRPSTGAKAAKPREKPDPSPNPDERTGPTPDPAEAPDTRSALQRLVDKFR